MYDKIRVLLVEDNPADAKAIYEYLRINYRNEFDFSHSLTMASAIKSLSENTFDTILLDLSLPDVSGLDTLNEIKGSAKDIPIIVFTGLNDEKISIEAIKAGAQDYVVKGIYTGPFIYRVIRYAIERKALEKEIEVNRSLLEKKSMQLQELNKNLEELNNNKDKFYSIVVHDLINPFNALSTTSQLLAETFNSGTNIEETNELIQLINESVKKISNKRPF